MTDRARKRGRPPKVPGGLDQALYVRASNDLVRALDEVVREEQQRSPGRQVSKADVIRKLLERAIELRRGEGTQ